MKTEQPSAQPRQRAGTLSGAVGIVLNLLLFALKLTAGLLSGSIAILADAFNNLSDAGSSLVTLAAFRMAGRKPDADHPFGHGRLEYIAGLVVSLLILLCSGSDAVPEEPKKIFRAADEEVTAPVSAEEIYRIFLDAESGEDGSDKEV